MRLVDLVRTSVVMSETAQAGGVRKPSVLCALVHSVSTVSI